MNIVKRIILSVIVMVGLVAAPIVLGTTAQAATPKQNLCVGSGGTWNGRTCTNANDNGGLAGFFKTIVNVLLFLVGAIAVIMVVVGGIRYVVSGGDTAAVTSAKNTVLYAVIGLLVAIMGYAIVNFFAKALT